MMGARFPTRPPGRRPSRPGHWRAATTLAYPGARPVPLGLEMSEES